MSKRKVARDLLQPKANKVRRSLSRIKRFDKRRSRSWSTSHHNLSCWIVLSLLLVRLLCSQKKYGLVCSAHVACSQDVLCFVAGLTSRHTAKIPSNASLGGGQFRCNILGSIIKSLVDRVASATLSHQTVVRSLGLAGSTRSLDDLATRVACVTSLRLYVLICVATILLLIASRSSIVAFSSSCHVPFTISNPCSQWDGHVCPAACGSWCRSHRSNNLLPPLRVIAQHRHHMFLPVAHHPQ